MNYQVYVLESAFETIALIKSIKRKEIREFIRSLSTDPFNQGDFSEVDSIGRTIFTRIIHSHAIVFVADHAAKEIKVIEVLQADE